jgi:hypothetical protein
VKQDEYDFAVVTEETEGVYGIYWEPVEMRTHRFLHALWRTQAQKEEYILRLLPTDWSLLLYKPVVVLAIFVRLSIQYSAKKRQD